MCLLCSCSRAVTTEKRLREEGISLMTEKQNYRAAIAKFDEALSMNEGKVRDLEIDILRYRAECEALMGDYEASAYTYSLLLRVDEEKPEYMNLRAAGLAKAGKELDEALDLYLKAEEADKNSAAHLEALYALGTAFARSGDEDRTKAARELYENALGDEELKSGELYNRMGMFCFDDQDYEKALKYFEMGSRYVKQQEGTEEDGVLRSLSFNYAVCCEYMHDYKKAYEAFRDFVKEYGTNDIIEHEMAFLETRIR